MGARTGSVSTAALPGSVTVTTTSETGIINSPPINPIFDNTTIFLIWCFTFVVGTAATALAVRIRRGLTGTGAIINAGMTALTVVAGNQITLSGCYPDNPGVVGAQTYQITVQQAGATGNGTASDGVFMALVL